MTVVTYRDGVLILIKDLKDGLFRPMIHIVHPVIANSRPSCQSAISTGGRLFQLTHVVMTQIFVAIKSPYRCHVHFLALVIFGEFLKHVHFWEGLL
jgi:hypothetical protein